MNRSYNIKVEDFNTEVQAPVKMAILNPELDKLEVTVDDGRIFININGMEVFKVYALVDGVITIEKA